VDTIILLFIAVISGLLILAPPIAVWRSLARRASGRASWLHTAVSLIGPFVAAYGFTVLMWLPAYSGRCGGWLGETTPCGFGQYATETLFWAALSMATPALLGILLGLAVLLLFVIRRGTSRPAG
jgi:hypothetical protein